MLKPAGRADQAGAILSPTERTGMSSRHSSYPGVPGGNRSLCALKLWGLVLRCPRCCQEGSAGGRHAVNPSPKGRQSHAALNGLQTWPWEGQSTGLPRLTRTAAGWGCLRRLFLAGRDLAGLWLNYAPCNSFSGRTPPSAYCPGLQLNPAYPHPPCPWLTASRTNDGGTKLHSSRGTPPTRPFSSSRISARRVADGWRTRHDPPVTSESFLHGKTLVSNIIIICLMLPKMAITGCWSVCASWETFPAVPTLRTSELHPVPGRHVAALWWARLASLAKKSYPTSEQLFSSAAASMHWSSIQGCGRMSKKGQEWDNR